MPIVTCFHESVFIIILIIHTGTRNKNSYKNELRTGIKMINDVYQEYI